MCQLWVKNTIAIVRSNLSVPRTHINLWREFEWVTQPSFANTCILIVILLSGERRGECKHSMPVWDQHDYCWLCRSNKMYFWAQDCQKTGPNCDMCKSWTDDQWNFRPKITTVPSLATASVQEKKKIRKKRRKKRQSMYTLINRHTFRKNLTDPKFCL